MHPITPAYIDLPNTNQPARSRMTQSSTRPRLNDTLLGLSRNQKRFVLMVNDAGMAALSLWLAFVLRIGPPPREHLTELVGLFLLIPGATVVALMFFGLYNHLLRELELRTLNIIAMGVATAAIVIAVYGYFDTTTVIPRSIPALFAIVAFLTISVSRMFGRWYYRQAMGLHNESQPIIIYGAGDTGLNTANILQNSPEFSLVGFIDDDRHLQGNRIKGRRIYKVEDLEQLCARMTNLRILLCIPKISSGQRRAVIEKLQAYPVQVLTIPRLRDVVAGRAQLDDIKEVKIQDLLGRDQVPPIRELFQQAIEGKVVLVSGGGGSIGSEICKQIAENKPAKVIALDNSEFALYQLEQLILKTAPERVKDGTFVFLLCNVRNKEAVEKVMQEHKPDVVYHAAAYKHVPIVERQPLQAIENNVIGTSNVANAAAAVGASHFILVSTDKAVRPTNVMGATKRVSELVIQGLAQEDTDTIFSSVRFGNVLGSSGSVIPLFRQQIANGGPVTVTHPDVIRYFMTIPEAAQLVIQAGFLARGGDVFILDMGEPVAIQKIARLMIQLSGKSARDADNPLGDIEIQYTGLRPGEKLYEELLIEEGNAEGTVHPKIMATNETSIPPQVMRKHLATFEKQVSRGEVEKSLDLLEKLVEGFVPESRREPAGDERS